MSFIQHLFVGALMGISSLFGHHAAPIQAVATSTPAAIIATTTATTSPYLPPVIEKIVHTPVKQAVSPVPTSAPVPAPPAPAAKLTCASGKEEVNDTCQWTQASLDAMNLLTQQAAKKKEIADGDIQQKISILQASYQDDIQDQQATENRQCSNAAYTQTEQMKDSAFGGTTAIAAGNKQQAIIAAIAKDAAACSALTASDQARIQGDAADETSLLSQISSLQSQL